MKDTDHCFIDTPNGLRFRSPQWGRMLDRPSAEFIKSGDHYYSVALCGNGVRVSGPFVGGLQPSLHTVHSQLFGVTWDE